MNKLNVVSAGRFNAVVESLHDWEEENDRPLPPGWTAEGIAAAEAAGLIVDLETGATMTGAEASDFTPKGGR